MLLTKATLAGFLERFNPVDHSTLLPGDEEAFLHLLFTGRIWEYRSFDARLLVPLEAAWLLRYVRGAEKRSWHERITALAHLPPDNAFWIVAMASDVPPATLQKAYRAKRTAIAAHDVRFKQGRGYAELRRERKRAWRTFMRIAPPAVQKGLRQYALFICSH